MGNDWDDANDWNARNDGNGRNGDLDRILLSEEPLTPSSGFAAAVMESVREAAAEPPPLAFPWMRLGAAAIACAAGAAVGVAAIAGVDWSATGETLASLQAAAPELGYAAAAVLASLLVLRVSAVHQLRRGD